MRTIALLLVLLSSSSIAAAQDPALASARVALATYDLSGPTTLAALRDLGPLVARGGAAATEARYLRAIAGADLYTLSIALADDTLAARLAQALGVEAQDLEPHLRAELASVRTGLYRRSALEELQLLDLTNALASGDLASIAAVHGARADTLRVLALADVARSPAGLSSLPDAPTPRFPFDRDVSAAAHAIESATAAHPRAMAAATLGDPWIARLSARMTAAMTTISAMELHARVAIAAGLVASTEAPGRGTADVVVAFDARHASFGCSPVLALSDVGAIAIRTVSPAGLCPVLPEVQRVGLGVLQAAPRSIPPLERAIAAAELAGARSVAVAPAAETELHVLVRMILSLEAAHVTATHLALRAADGTLAMVPVRVAHEAELGPIELAIRLRLGGYTIARGRGREVEIPRVRDGDGLAFDRAGLLRAMRERPPSSVSIDGMAGVAASELVETARLAEQSGARVTIVLP